MNWRKDEDLTQMGIFPLPEIKKIPLGNSSYDEYQVYSIPLNLLSYNLHNGRIFMEVNRLKVANDVDIESLKLNDVEEYNKEIENLIWESSPEKNEYTMKDIELYTQLESGVVLSDGTVIDGNRRFTCLRRLHEIHPDDERFSTFNAAILFLDDSHITGKDIKRYELRVQFGRDEKVDYKPVNFAMSIYQEIKSGSFTVQEMADNVNKKASEITKIVNTCQLIEDFLEHINQKDQLYIAEELNVYWPLENLASYLNGSSGARLSEIEKNKRKNLYYDYILTLDISLPTQELRDNLIKKVFKDSDLCDELIATYETESGEKVNSSILQNNYTPEEFVEKVKEFKKTEDAKTILDTYKKKVEKKNLEAMADAPVRMCEEALERIKKVNIVPLVKATSSTADDKLRKISDLLEETECGIKDLKTQIAAKLGNNE